MIASIQVFWKFSAASILFCCSCLYGGMAPEQDSAKRSMQSGQSTHSSQKYRRVFFPGGMPSSEDPFSGALRKTLYAFYEEAPLDSFKAVLYSQETPSDAGHDGRFAVHLALLAGSAARWEVSQDVDITEYVSVQTEFPGNFLKMDARLNSFAIENGKHGLHVNLWAVLSGSGSVSGASDLFYTLDSGNRIHLILALKGTSKYSHLGMQETQVEDSRILVGDIEGNGSAEIVVESGKSTVSNGQVHSKATTAVVYKYINGAYQLSGTLSAESAAKLNSLSVLPRSKLIPGVPRNEIGCAGEVGSIAEYTVRI